MPMTKPRSSPSLPPLRIVAATVVLALIAALVTVSCATVPDRPRAAAATPSQDPIGLDNLNAVLWAQTAVEYRANSWQAYELARRALDEALADPTRTAALEQTGDFSGLPPAVILDIDETVLDNYAFEARLTVDAQAYSDQLWEAWVRQEAATTIPGAREFCDYAAGRGVTVFFVTNRMAPLEAPTRANLAKEGFPLPAGVDTVLLRNERPEWASSDKGPRRREIASSYRILLQVGDNMGDFVSAADGTVAERLAFAEQHRDAWGTLWITLANPTYGSWLGAVLDNRYSLPYAQQVEIKKSALEPRR
jgi:acid phosphatase